MKPPYAAWLPWLALAVGVLAYAWIVGNPLAVRIVATLLLVPTLSTLAALPAPLRHVAVRRELPTIPVHAGQDVPVTLTLRMARRWPWFYLTIRDQASRENLAAVPPRIVAFPWFRREVTVRYRLTAVPRGIHTLGPVVLESGDPFGFLVRRHTVNVPGTLEVWPAVVAVPADHVAQAGERAERRGGRRLPADPAEVTGVRAMTAGDRWHHIHWVSTARTGQYMVKQLVAFLAPTALVAVDTPAAFTPGQFELALAVAASLVTAHTRCGLAVGLALPGGDVVLAPRVGLPHFRHLMHALAAIHYDDAGAKRAGPSRQDERPPAVPLRRLSPDRVVWISTRPPHGAPTAFWLPIGPGGVQKLQDLSGWLRGSGGVS